MAAERLPMHSIREILRQRWVLKMTHRQIASSIGISAGTVGSVMIRARAKALQWQQVESLSDVELEEMLYGRKQPSGSERAAVDPLWIHTELRRPGVTLELLHVEYLDKHPNGYRYSAFCEHYHRWVERQRLSMRQVHRGGDKMFVDYSGKKPHIIDAKTGEVIEVELFVAVLGASNLTYAEASRSQRGADFIPSHVRAVEYFGGVTALVVPDQLRSGIKSPCRYEPFVQRTYAQWARHYGTAVLPARPRKPRDKAKVEVAVQVVQRWILARLRNESFFSLEALNERIWQLLDELNARPMRGYGGQSRRELFERFDKPLLRPLPTERFIYGEWRKARVNIDYHIEVERHYYSVPHSYIHAEVEVWLTASTVEVFHRGTRIATHRRSGHRGQHTTVAEHMPKSHRAHREWSPTRLMRWAETIGENTALLVRSILESRPHPEQGYRSCLGILRLSKRYDAERLEAACRRALRAGAKSFRHVDAILKHGLDRLPHSAEATVEQTTVVHENIRGPRYYN